MELPLKTLSIGSSVFFIGTWWFKTSAFLNYTCSIWYFWTKYHKIYCLRFCFNCYSWKQQLNLQKYILKIKKSNTPHFLRYLFHSVASFVSAMRDFRHADLGTLFNFTFSIKACNSFNLIGLILFFSTAIFNDLVLFLSHVCYYRCIYLSLSCFMLVLALILSGWYCLSVPSKTLTHYHYNNYIVRLAMYSNKKKMNVAEPELLSFYFMHWNQCQSQEPTLPTM